MYTRGSIAIAVSFLLISPAAGHAGLDRPDLCQNNKAKAAGGKAKDVLRAFGKNVGRPNPARLATLILKAQARLTRRFSREDVRGGCLTTGDVAAIEAKVDALALDVANLSGRIGGDFPVTDTSDLLGGADIGVAADGSFVVVWKQGSPTDVLPGDGSEGGVYGRRFGSDGTPMGDKFQVNTYTTGDQGDPSVGVAPDGSFVVVWHSRRLPPQGIGQDGDMSGIFGQRYDGAGGPIGAEFQVNTYTTGWQEYPVVRVADDGAFVVVWEDFGQDGDSRGLFGQRYDSVGVTAGSEFQVNSITTGPQRDAAVAVHPDGDFVVVWRRSGGIVGQRYESDGATLDGEFQISTYTGALAVFPSVEVEPTGGFVVAWQEGYSFQTSRDGDDSAIFGQRFDSTGAAVGPDFQVNTYTTSAQQRPFVDVAADGSFVVVWERRDDFDDPVGQRFDSSGGRVGSEFRATPDASGIQLVSGLGVAPVGNFVVIWWDQGPLFGQRFSQ